MEHVYEVTLEVRTNKPLNEQQHIAEARRKGQL